MLWLLGIYSSNELFVQLQPGSSAFGQSRVNRRNALPENCSKFPSIDIYQRENNYQGRLISVSKILSQWLLMKSKAIDIGTHTVDHKFLPIHIRAQYACAVRSCLTNETSIEYYFPTNIINWHKRPWHTYSSQCCQYLSTLAGSTAEQKEVENRYSKEMHLYSLQTHCIFYQAFDFPHQPSSKQRRASFSRESCSI